MISATILNGILVVQFLLYWNEKTAKTPKKTKGE